MFDQSPIKKMGNYDVFFHLMYYICSHKHTFFLRDADCWHSFFIRKKNVDKYQRKKGGDGGGGGSMACDPIAKKWRLSVGFNGLFLFLNKFECSEARIFIEGLDRIEYNDLHLSKFAWLSSYF